jgi:DNA repair exonuclease SbcCD ATPase subunit
MILLTRIEITNIRSIARGIIEPLPDGITALVGVIGTGKTTFLEAARWVLYGEVPGGLRQAEMRRHTADGEKCEAAVEFTLGGTPFRAVRGLRQKVTKGRLTETAYAALFIGGVRQPQITPTKLTDKIVQLTGLTGRAFTGAFFIPQNRLPILAQGTPGEVQQVFEEQTGLSPLSRRVETAHRDAGQALVAAEALPGSAEAVTAAQEALDIAQAERSLAQRQLDTAKATADTAKRALADAEATYNLLMEQRSAAEQARLDAARAETRVAGLDETIHDLEEQVRNLPCGDGQEARHRLTQLRTARQAAEHAEQAMESATRRVEDARTRLDRARQQLGRLPVDLDERLDAAQQVQAHAEQAVGHLRGEHGRLSRAVQTLQAADPGAACCPTCNQRVADLAGLLTDLRLQKARCEAEGRRAAEHAQVAGAEAADLTEAVRQRETARNALDQAERDLCSADAARSTAGDRAKATLDALAALLRTTGDDLTKILKTAEQAEEAAVREVGAVQHALQVRTRLTKARSDRARVQSSLDELRARAAGTPTAEQLTDISGALASARDDWETHAARRAEAETKAEVLAERCRVLEATRDGEQELLNRKLAALGQADILRHAAHMLAGLRRDLLAEYTATVSEAATDLLRQIGGEHTAFHIDERFVPEVILGDGTHRPLRTLSGGEQARAALCFCLGISAQITGGSHTGTIIADEITAAHDDDTRHAIVELLRDLGWPLLIVAHSPEIMEIANRVAWLRKPDEACGTQVVSPTTKQIRDESWMRLSSALRSPVRGGRSGTRLPGGSGSTVEEDRPPGNRVAMDQKPVRLRS